MNHRERVMAALEHRDTDRVPIAMVCSGIQPPAYHDLQAWLLEERGISVDEYLDPMIDIRHVGPDYRGPRLAVGCDFWGVERAPVSYGSGAYDEITRHPLAGDITVDDLARYPWPIEEWFDYPGFADRLAADAAGGHSLMISGGNPFESAWYLRGFEQAMMDMVLNVGLLDELMDRVNRFFLRHLERQLQAAAGRIDLVFTADDIGGQGGLLFSLGMWERFIRPHHVALNRLVHQYGARVIYHSDGAVMEAVPGLVEAGIDVLQALQFDAAGMDPRALKERHGNRLCFEGGISVQSTLPFGTVDEVRAEVRERKRVLGRGGGYILGPSHAIQAGTPAANIVAMFDEAALPT